MLMEHCDLKGGGVVAGTSDATDRSRAAPASTKHARDTAAAYIPTAEQLKSGAPPLVSACSCIGTQRLGRACIFLIHNGLARTASYDGRLRSEHLPSNACGHYLLTASTWRDGCKTHFEDKYVSRPAWRDGCKTPFEAKYVSRPS